ncbi:hypothetical protein [Pedosphaera parvula]|uniref:Uncharacterized protein n=1 Tax=Pedosphaera parvula (strain Ellin514) TaxID=320771 RepID=B9XSA2_PEDPL|nr:hypothetical protein [Pedosphaera parvula]EEF57272.1 hypothetical protein Cflav_PD0238 [Pedosphaera parvula Ellin514]
MKNLGLLLTLWLASIYGLKAQVAVEVTMDRDQFLPNESVPVAVRVVNRSGQTIHLGKEVDWLTFSVESHDGFIIAKYGEVPVMKEFDLQSSERATRRCDLSPYFNLGQPGHYSVIATVRIKDWNIELSSEPKTFDVIQGTKIWEQEFGVPGKALTNTALPEVRKYILQQATFMKESSLYLRLTDATETQCYKLIRVGPMSSVSHPEPKLDKASNLHLVYQTGSRIFTYSLVNPSGELIKRQTYEYANSRPRLGIDDEGKVSVVGGSRRIASSDLPVASPTSSPNDVPPPKP